MRKIRAEMPSNPQQNHPGMPSNAPVELDGATVTGDVRVIAGPARGVGSECWTGDGGVIIGGDLRGGMAEGRRIRAISCLAPSFWRPGIVSGFWGSEMRTVSFFGSAMTNQVAPRKIAENSFDVTR
jgi:hypothetical protein